MRVAGLVSPLTQCLNTDHTTADTDAQRRSPKNRIQQKKNLFKTNCASDVQIARYVFTTDGLHYIFTTYCTTADAEAQRRSSAITHAKQAADQREKELLEKRRKQVLMRACKF